MAELIPLEYRIAVARSAAIHRWAMGTGLMAVMAVAGLVCTYNWRSQQAAKFAKLDDDYRRNYALVNESKELQARRGELATRMARIESLRGDNILLSLLGNVSQGFTERDCLQYMRVEAHLLDQKTDEQKYFVRIRGITMDDTSYSALYQRLTEIGKKSTPAIAVPLGEHHVTKVINGDATFFEFTCERPAVKTLASSDKGN